MQGEITMAIELFSAKRGQRGTRCRLERIDDNTILMSSTMPQFYGKNHVSEMNLNLEMAKYQVESYLADQGEINEWDDKLAEAIGVSRPAEVQ